MNPLLAESVIVYHSKMEQRQDEFWNNFVDENSTAIYYGFLAIAGLIIVSFVWSFLSSARKRASYRSNRGWRQY